MARNFIYILQGVIPFTPLTPLPPSSVRPYLYVNPISGNVTRTVMWDPVEKMICIELNRTNIMEIQL